MQKRFPLVSQWKTLIATPLIFSLAFLGVDSLLVSQPVVAATRTAFFVEPPSGCQQVHGSFIDTTVEAVLAREGIVARLEDKVSAFPDPALGIGSTVTYCPAPEYIVLDAGVTTKYLSWAQTPEELLAERRVEVGSKDQINLQANAPLVAGQQIEITRVAETEVVVPVALDFKTIYNDDASLERGVEKVEQTGKQGRREDTYLVRRENGVEVSRQKIGSEVVSEPVEKIVRRGTKVIVYGTGKATFCNLLRIGGCTNPLSAASNTLPKGTRVRVVNVANGKSVVVTINDSGIQTNAIIDISADAFAQIGSLSAGIIQVRVEKE